MTSRALTCSVVIFWVGIFCTVMSACQDFKLFTIVDFDHRCRILGVQGVAIIALSIQYGMEYFLQVKLVYSISEKLGIPFVNEYF